MSINEIRHEIRDSPVRPQAAEAMGAISSQDSIPVLKQYLNHSNPSIRETCEIAVAKIEWDHSDEGRQAHTSTNEETP
jgi:deoxyhypusine monooxygenase